MVRDYHSRALPFYPTTWANVTVVLLPDASMKSAQFALNKPVNFEIPTNAEQCY
jgi:hypothetical protein